jgi:hypothetical protein
MARSTAEIQADIALTRRLIEHRLDDLRSAVPDRWWTPYALVATGLGAGVLLSQIPVVRLLRISTRLVQAGLSAVSVMAALGLLSPRKRRAA